MKVLLSDYIALIDLGFPICPDLWLNYRLCLLSLANSLPLTP